MSEKVLSIDLRYELTGKPINSRAEDPTFIRGDSILIKGKVFGATLTGITATLTGKMILPDGSVGPVVFTKSSAGTGAAITLTTVNPSISLVDIALLPEDTEAFEPGQRFVFDVEVKTTTPAITRSIKGGFGIEEDYTV